MTQTQAPRRRQAPPQGKAGPPPFNAVAHRAVEDLRALKPRLDAHLKSTQALEAEVTAALSGQAVMHATAQHVSMARKVRKVLGLTR